MNERIKLLRNAMGLSQEEFGKLIGISKSGISSIESGQRNVTDKHVKLLIMECNLNEDWLRTGEGSMFTELMPEDEFAAAAAELSRDGDKIAMQAVIEYWKLDEDSKKLFRDFLVHIVENVKNKE
jgi:transcriptional regulator with XRE-family HTH domain